MSAHDHVSASADIRGQLLELAHHLEHVLPAQAPIRDFVHHNTLHGYQHLPFEQAVREARLLTGATGYLPEARCRELYREGRISRDDLLAALETRDDLGLDEVLCTASNGLPPIRRRQVLFAAMVHPFKGLSRSQLKWQIDEMHALERFQPDVDDAVKTAMLGASSRHESELVADLWSACLAALGLEHAARHPEELIDPSPELTRVLAERIVAEAGEAADDGRNLGIAARLIREEAHRVQDRLFARLGREWTLRTLLFRLTGEDLLESLRPALIRHFSAHIDQGLAAWRNPARDLGFYAAWRQAVQGDPIWRLDDLPEWEQYAERLPDEAIDTLIQELRLLGLPEERWPGYLERLSLELPGWSGMALWRSGHAGYCGQATPVSMIDYLAVYLVLERIHAQRICRRHWRIEASVSGLSWHFRHQPAELLVRHALYGGRLPEYLVDFAERLVRDSEHHPGSIQDDDWQTVAQLIWSWRQTPAADRKQGVSVAGSGWRLFRLAQHLGLSADDVRRLGRAGVDRLLDCLDLLDADAAGFIWLQAYERHYREQIFATLAANHARWPGQVSPEAQLVFCMDDREEGTRRHLEEVNPRIETFGAAGFFGVAINWRGLDDPGVTPLCPVVVTPSHEVREEVRPGAEPTQAAHVQRRSLRQKWKQHLHQGSRFGLVGPALVATAAAPLTLGLLAGKLLFPSRIGQLGERLREAFDLSVPTRATLCAPADSPAATPQAPRLGFTDTEQADRVQGFLRTIGLISDFAPLVVMVGHGSNSLNNPHMAAYDCGACSGRHGGPNARVFAAMANRPEVRALLAERGLVIPATTWFLGAEHNTCDEFISFYDLDAMPEDFQPAYAKLQKELDAATAAHAQERCRRFASAPSRPSPQRAWRHVLDRRWDFSQPRPELGHATNATAFIGRRTLSRGAFFDRRAFLISYDPSQDAEGKILENILLAAGPVGAGISLEYYFSTVDNDRYGCGSKTTHNVAGYFGVMEGASSDLRTGLPRQMIEIHEAMRLLVVVEHRIDVITAIYQRQPPLQELIGNGWIIVAAKDPDNGAIHLFDPARGWIAWQGEAKLPQVEKSADWFTGHRDPLTPALLTRPVVRTTGMEA